MVSYIYVMGRFPDYFFYFYSIILAMALLIYRQFEYQVKRWHYFTIDFCYIGSYLTYIFVMFYPNSKFTYIWTFAYSWGMIAYGTVIANSSLVLHDRDYMTSWILHINPMLIAYNLHWVSQYNKERGWELYDNSQDYLSFSFVWYFYLASTSLYLVWAVIYYIILFVTNAKSIEKHQDITLFSYCIAVSPMWKKLWFKFGPEYAPPFFIITHYVKFTLTTTVSLIWYFSIHANILAIILIFGVSVWNGASFYMDYFPKKYETNLAKIDEIYKSKIQEKEI